MTDIITKCDNFFITKCDKFLLQNAAGFLLRNLIVLLENKIVIKKCDDFVMQWDNCYKVHYYKQHCIMRFEGYKTLKGTVMQIIQ